MKLVSATFGNEVNHATGGIGILSAEIVGLNLVLLDSVDWRKYSGPVECWFSIRASVHDE